MSDAIFSPIAARLRERAEVYRSKGCPDHAADLLREADEAERLASHGFAPAPSTAPVRPLRAAPAVVRAVRPTANAVPPLRAKHHGDWVASQATRPPLIGRPVEAELPSSDVDRSRWLNIPQAARTAGVSRRTIYKWITDGLLVVKPAIGGGQLVLESSLWRNP